MNAIVEDIQNVKLELARKFAEELVGDYGTARLILTIADQAGALAADAARYRFITAHIGDEGDMEVLERAFERMGETCTQAEFDACIDAAIAIDQRQAGVQ